MVIMLALQIVSCDSSPPTSPADPAKPAAPLKSETELRAVLRQTCDEVNRFYKVENFPLLVSSQDSCQFHLRTDDFTKETVATFDTNENPMVISAAMDAASGKFLRFTSYEVEYAYEDSPRFEKPPPAKWSEAKAIEIASKFADILIKPWKKEYLGKPTAHFRYSGQGIDRKTGKWVTGEGGWEVEWNEHTPSGIPIFGNGVSVSISEKYGPYHLGIGCDLPEDEIAHLTVISRDEALVEARKGLDAAVTQERAEGRAHNDSGGLVIQGESEMRLEVLRPPKPGGLLPSDLFLPKSLPNSGFLSQSKARLAWRVKYYYSTSKPYERGYIAVYIDAENGSVLCCSYPEDLA